MNLITAMIVLFSVLGGNRVCSLYCHNCLSLEKYNPDCVVLNGHGKDNVNKYYIKCSEERTACSLHIGRFDERRDKPRIVVTRKCDFKWNDEPDCRDEHGPDEIYQTSGWTCKCSTDFCNWREGVDIVLAQEMSTLPFEEYPTTQIGSRGATPLSSRTIISVITFFAVSQVLIWN